MLSIIWLLTPVAFVVAFQSLKWLALYVVVLASSKWFSNLLEDGTVVAKQTWQALNGEVSCLTNESAHAAIFGEHIDTCFSNETSAINKAISQLKERMDKRDKEQVADLAKLASLEHKLMSDYWLVDKDDVIKVKSHDKFNGLIKPAVVTCPERKQYWYHGNLDIFQTSSEAYEFLKARLEKQAKEMVENIKTITEKIEKINKQEPAFSVGDMLEKPADIPLAEIPSDFAPIAVNESTPLLPGNMFVSSAPVTSMPLVKPEAPKKKKLTFARGAIISALKSQPDYRFAGSERRIPNEMVKIGLLAQREDNMYLITEEGQKEYDEFVRIPPPDKEK